MAKSKNDKTTTVNDVVNKKDIGVISKKARDDAINRFKVAPFTGVDLTKDRLLQYDDVQYLYGILDILWPRSNFSPYQLKQTTTNLVNAGIQIKYRDPEDPASKAQLMQAYVARTGRAKYEIFINGDTEAESFESADLHEKGHVLYQHTDGVKLYLDIFKKELDKIWDEKVKKWFTDDAQKGYKRDKIVKFIFAQFSNIAQDMEINSKLFESEWIKAKKTLSRSSLVMCLKDLNNQFNDATFLLKEKKAQDISSKQYAAILGKFEFIRDNLERRSKNEIDDILFCYPTYYNWPEKLDWMTYIMLLVKNHFDDVMEQVQKQMQAAMSGNGNGQGNGSGKGQVDPSGKRISKDALDDYFDKAEKDAEAQDGNGGGGDGDEEGEESDDEVDGGGGPQSRSEGGSDRSNSGAGNWKSDIETCETFDQFVKFLNKICLGKELRKLTTDLLYNSNRRKTNNLGGVLLPRRYSTAKWMPTAITIVVDISGSVATDYVERIINAIISANSGVDLKKSHILFTDTRVEKDEFLNKRTTHVYSGGGTDIAVGINEAFKYVKKPTDKLLVISDFEDNLDRWVKVAEGKPGIKYAIGYNVNGDKEFNPTKSMSRWLPSNEAGQKFVKVFKTMFITEVIDK
jgi:hypothetical protein